MNFLLMNTLHIVAKLTCAAALFSSIHAQQMTIDGYLESDANYTDFHDVVAVNDELHETLNSFIGDANKSLTLIAPNNDAFSKIMDTWTSVEKLELADHAMEVAKYHIWEGTFQKENYVDGQKITTLQGEDVVFRETGDGSIMFEGSGQGQAKILQVIKSSNGVILATDTVLFPAAVWDLLPQGSMHESSKTASEASSGVIFRFSALSLLATATLALVMV